MILLDKKFRRELEQQLQVRYSGAALNGFVEIAVGEAISDYHLAVDKGVTIPKPKGYIYKTAINKIENEKERLKKLNRIDDESEAGGLLLILDSLEHDEEMKQLIIELLNMISLKQREAILLHHRDGYSINEVSEKLKISPSAVKKRIYEGKIEIISIYRKKSKNS